MKVLVKKWLSDICCSCAHPQISLILKCQLLRLRRGFPDLPKAASTGPASERCLLVLDGPSAGLSPGGASCPACEPRRPAADAQTGNEHPQTRRLENLTCFESYWLLLTEEEAAQLRIGPRVGEAEDGTLRWRLSTLCHLIGGGASLLLLVCRYSCSHGHLKEPNSCQVKMSRTGLRRLRGFDG